MTALTLGIAGAGAILEAHAGALAQLPAIRVTGVCDLDEGRRAAAAARFGAAAHADLDGLLRSPPEVALIALPHGLHHDATVAALEAGCHVIVEKPMAVSVAQCNRMLAAAERAGRRLWVAEGSAALPGPVRTGAACAAGDLGRFLTGSIVNARFYFVDGRPGWFLDPGMSGGGMFANVGLHRLAVARTCLPGARPIAVTATVGRVVDRPVEACTSALVRYADGGGMLYEEVGLFPRPAWLSSGTHLVFEAGIVGWDQDTWRLQTRTGERVEPLAPASGYLPVYAEVLRALRGPQALDGLTVEVPAHGFAAGELAADVAIAQGAYASARSGTAVDLDHEDWRIRACA